MVKTILIHLDEKKHEAVSKIKNKHSHTWEDVLDVYIRVMRAK